MTFSDADLLGILRVKMVADIWQFKGPKGAVSKQKYIDSLSLSLFVQ